MNRDITADILSAEERRPGDSSAVTLGAEETPQFSLQRRNRLLERQVADQQRELERSRVDLRSLSEQLDLAEKRERQNLATELHDYLAQLLVLGHMKIGELKRVALPPKADEIARDVEDVLTQALQYCRTLMAELSSPILRKEGLDAGIRSLALELKRQSLDVTVATAQMDDCCISESSAILLFRSVRELLLNTVKHSSVKQATIRMTCEKGFLRIVVRDEGGFNVAASAADTRNVLSSKFGLLTIKERMIALNGRLEFESLPGCGTTATLIVPTRGQ